MPVRINCSHSWIEYEKWPTLIASNHSFNYQPNALWTMKDLQNGMLCCTKVSCQLLWADCPPRNCPLAYRKPDGRESMTHDHCTHITGMSRKMVEDLDLFFHRLLLRTEISLDYTLTFIDPIDCLVFPNLPKYGSSWFIYPWGSPRPNFSPLNQFTKSWSLTFK